MKFSNISFSALLVFVLFLSACDCDEVTGPQTETIPFEATLFTSAGPNSLKNMCDDPVSPTSLWLQEHQVGNGTATELGAFTTELIFCIHITFDEEMNPDPSGEGFGEYKDGYGFLQAENGERIFVSIPEGQVKLSANPDYFFEFQDAIYITGGTGPYVGATGELVSDSYVDGDGTDHVWTGTITLIK